MHRIASRALILLLVAAAVSAFAQEPGPAFLFVQSAGSGTLSPVADEPGRFTLTLRGVSPKTIFFSDRPERIAGQAAIEEFLAGLGFDDDNPPNAALEILGGAESGDVAVVELRNPRYDAATATLTYDVALLADAATGAPAFFADRADTELPAEFGEAALFIDDCADGKAFCFAVVDYDKGYPNPHGSALGSVPFGQCWKMWAFKCVMCDGQGHRITPRCKEKFGSRCGDKCRGCVPRGVGSTVTYDCY